MGKSGGNDGIHLAVVGVRRTLRWQETQTRPWSGEASIVTHLRRPYLGIVALCGHSCLLVALDLVVYR
jgi:hypothetical protein